LPDISKINALDIGSVSKVDGLAKASILDIDGVAVPSGLAPAAAYSVRLLGSGVGISSYTGPAMRVRRDTAGGTGDDDEADIAFDSGVISLDSAISNASAGVTATTLGQFLNVGTVGGTTYTNPDSLSGTASCFVDEWKDQSGNANHASQATFGSQPQIHSGTVNTDLITENGKPAVDFDGSNDRLVFSNTGLDIGSLSSCTVGKFNSTSQTAGMMQLSGSSSNKRWYAPFEFSATYRFGYVTTLTINGGTSDTSQHLFTMMAGSTLGNASAWVDGAFKNSATLDSGISNIALIGDADGTYADCLVQELVVWGADQSSNRTGIESDIMTYFSIP